MQDTSSIGRVTPAAPSQRPASVREPPSDEPSNRAVPEAAPGKPVSVSSKPPSFAAGGAHARLTYDVEDADVYIEILNPRTGDVIRRLPPEDAAPLISDITNSAPGAVIDGTV